MEISFEDKSLRDICVNPVRMDKQFGARLAAKLRRCLADIDAAAGASELFSLPGNTRELSGSRSGEIVIDLVDGYELHMVPALETERAPIASGSVDWANIRRIKILGLVNGNV